MLSALSLTLFNAWQEEKRAESAKDKLSQVVDQMTTQSTTQAPTVPTTSPAETTQALETTAVTVVTEPTVPQMKEAVLDDGNAYIGYVSIPSLNIELPVLSNWDDSLLDLGPCRFSGSVYTDDMVLMAHNYKKHFGPLLRIKLGADVYFTDMEGNTIHYQVITTEVLQPDESERMVNSDYDLSLFTCTLNVNSRHTVRCNRVEE